MDTVEILNNYRKVVANDKVAIQILSWLLKSGPCKEDDLIEHYKWPPQNLFEKLNELYRANLICIVPYGRWTTTEFAEEILAHLGISEVVASSLLNEQTIPENEISFLNACIMATTSTKPQWSRFQTALLKSFIYLKKDIFIEVFKSPKELIRLLYAAIVGLDLDLQQLGSKKYCDYVFEWHQDHESQLWNDYKNSWLQNKKAYEVKCRLAIEDTRRSNAFISIKGNNRGKNIENIMNLSLLRIITAIVTNYADVGLASAFSISRELPVDIWITFEEKHKNFSLKFKELLFTLGKVPIQNEENIQEFFKLILKALSDGSKREGNYLLSDFTSRSRRAVEYNSNMPSRGQGFEQDLTFIVSQIIHDNYDSFIRNDMKIIEIFNKAQETFLTRYGTKTQNTE